MNGEFVGGEGEGERERGGEREGCGHEGTMSIYYTCA